MYYNVIEIIKLSRLNYNLKNQLKFIYQYDELNILLT